MTPTRPGVWSASETMAHPPIVSAPPPVPNPAMRASTADRQRYADYLSQAYATGQLDDTELSARLDAALGAKTLGDLEPLAADLNFAGMAVTVPAAPSPTKAVVVPPRRNHRVRRLVAAGVAAIVLLTGAGMARAFETGADVGGGRWGPPMGQRQGGPAARVGDQVVPYSGPASRLPADGLRVNVGSATADMTGVVVDANTTFPVRVSLGAGTIMLPATGNVVVNYDVRLGEVTIKGPGQDVRTSGGAGQRGTYTRTTDPGGPVLTINATLDMGSLDIRG